MTASLGKDTSPLEPMQLSDNEVQIILQIEHRLKQAGQSARDKNYYDDSVPYLMAASKRDPRVLLLDGNRGTGKSSLLFTLAHRWRQGMEEDSANRAPLMALYGDRSAELAALPTFVRALPLLDFDPLPSTMPLLGAIVQTWRPLVRLFDQLSGKLEDASYQGDMLIDNWHELFQFAVAGWTDAPQGTNLIEQILEREEQVKDWHRFRERWQSFVNNVIESGKRLEKPHTIAENSVFVIIIDDVDLQVERVRELLPALRMLYHSKVVFVVAGHREHMIDMVELDFAGHQKKLARGFIKGVELKRWPEALAKASFQKVFPLTNRWELRQLSLYDLLNFPNKQENYASYLNSWTQRDDKTLNFGTLGEYLSKMAGKSDDPNDLPEIMSYRTAHQIFEHAQEQSADQGKARIIIRGILGQLENDTLVKVRKKSDEESTEEQKSKKAKPKNKSGADPNREYVIQYSAIGDLVALFPRVFEEPLKSDSEIVLSAQPDFIYRHGPHREEKRHGSVEFTSALLATSLREDGYGVVALGLQWNIRLALAWTAVRLVRTPDLSLDLAFRWQFYQHPSPMRLYTWAKDWRDFIDALSKNTDNRLERIAYAWIYYQLRWMSEEPTAEMKHLPKPLDDKIDDDDAWESLLSVVPQSGTKEEKERWKTRILPLMARPELGLPPNIQTKLLQQAGTKLEAAWLSDQRQRRVTDAIIAAAELSRAAIPSDAENQRKVIHATNLIDKRYLEDHGRNPWVDIIDKYHKKTVQP